MSVEYGTSQYSSEIRAAMDKLATACGSDLRQMQESGRGGTLSFTDNWKRTKQHKSTHPQNPVLNRLSRIALNFDVPTWVTYQYWDGNISAGLFQKVGEETKLIQLHESIEVEEIPFDKFSERDLFEAAQTIEKNLKPAPASD